MNDEQQPRMISAFEHENALMHYGMVNKRSFFGLLAVCLTFILITLIFVLSYNAREEKLTAIIDRLCSPPAVTEVQNGIHEQQDP